MLEEYLNNKGNSCPICEGLIEAYDSRDYQGATMTQDVSCHNCGATWKDVYQLVGISDLEVEDQKIEVNEVYTVMLLRPEYATDDYGTDTYTTYVEASDAELAIVDAKSMCATADYRDGDDQFDQYVSDLHVLAVMKGKVEFVR